MNFNLTKDEDNNTVKLAGLKVIKVQITDQDAVRCALRYGRAPLYARIHRNSRNRGGY